MRFSTSTIAYAALLLSTAEAAPFWGFGNKHQGGGRNASEGTGSGSGSGSGFGSGEGSEEPSFPSGVFPSDGAAFPTGGFPGGSSPSGGLGGRPSGGFGGFPSGGFSGFPGGDEPAETGFPGGEFPSGGFPGGDEPSETGFPSGGFPGGDEPSETGFPGGEFPGASGIASGPAATQAPTLPTGGAGGDVSSVSFELPSTAGEFNAAADEEKSTKTKKTKTKSSKTKVKSTAAASTPTSGSGSGSGSSEEEAATSAAPAPTSGSGSGSGSSSGNSTTPSTGSGGKANANFPTATGEETLSAAQVIAAGESFDGGLKRYGRGVSCTGQSEGGDKDAVFQIEEGGSLSNVIIGADQIEGVHCMGSCTLTNVWFEAVCEDAITIKQESGTSTISGGGAQGASDKVVQHNGGGTVAISGFYVSDFGKLYRSCGNCKTMYERHVTIDGVLADGGSSTFVGINSNYGDTATITNSCVTGTKKICEEFEGNDTGAEPKSIGDGPSDACKYTDADINAC